MYKDLSRRIVDGEIAMGNFLIEKDLCDYYRLSRTPIREALTFLQNDGLVKYTPSKGYSVVELSVEEMIETYHARIGLEGIAARLVHRYKNHDFIEQLEQTQARLEQTRASGTKEIARAVQIGRSLHDLIIDSAQNRMIKEFYAKLRNRSKLIGTIINRSEKIELRSIEGHLNIIHAILKKDEKASENAMRKHLTESLNGLVSILVGPSNALVDEP